jgi:hypothetical protein
MTTSRAIALIGGPIGVLLLSAARLIIVANFNTTTAVTIASSGGFVNTLLGTVIPLVPVFIPYFALLLLLTRHFLLSILAFAFTAFITPTSIRLTDIIYLVKEDWYSLTAVISENRQLIILIVLVILVLLWAYNRSLLEALSAVVALAVAVALLYAVPDPLLSQPIRLASNDNQGIFLRASSGAYGFSGLQILMALIVLAVIIVLLVYPNGPRRVAGFSWALSVGVALVATIALFPYVRYLYPVPHYRNYYTEAAHAMWLPAEKIELSTHRIYYGYILSSDGGWFTVLSANSRRIVYLSADDVVGRSVCQPRLTAQPPQYPPLVPWLYNPPVQLPACANYDGTTSLTSFLSKGQSLIEISMGIQRCPLTVINVTNAHTRGGLSRAMRSYERARKWDKHTPIGQRFWYYPRFTPSHFTCPHTHVSW